MKNLYAVKIFGEIQNPQENTVYQNGHKEKLKIHISVLKYESITKNLYVHTHTYTQNMRLKKKIFWEVVKMEGE